jgi:hypothetical protein
MVMDPSKFSAPSGLLPPPPPGAAGPFALSLPGALEQLVESAGLVPSNSGQVPTPYEYPDVDTAVRASRRPVPLCVLRSRPARKPSRGLYARSCKSYERPDGRVRLNSVFRYLAALT